MCLCVALHKFGVRQSPNVPERCVLTAHKQFSCTWIAQLRHQLAHFAQSAGVPVFRINRLSARHSSNWVGWVDCVSVDSDSQSGLNRFWCASAHWTALSCKCTWRCVICRTSSHLSVTYVRFCLFFCEQFKKKKEHTVCVFVYIYIYIHTHTQTHTHTHTHTYIHISVTNVEWLLPEAVLKQFVSPDDEHCVLETCREFDLCLTVHHRCR